MDDAPVLTERVNGPQKDSDSSSDQEASDSHSDDSEGKEEESKGDDDDFSAVKLCSKHAAFVRFRPKEGHFVHYATQNERS